jgi:sec-independent protein translocase protein TatB
VFDVGFSELVVIGVVALVFIGPERLPAVARTFGALLGRAQRYVNDVKSEVNRELQLEELRRIQQETHDRVMSMGAEVNQEIAQVDANLNAVAKDAAQAVTDASTPSAPALPAKAEAPAPAKSDPAA